MWGVETLQGHNKKKPEKQNYWIKRHNRTHTATTVAFSILNLTKLHAAANYQLGKFS